MILAKRISRIPFLSCKPLEIRGASPIDAIQASVLGARNCDIYVGIFGRRYSIITVKEYNEAKTKFKPPFIYVKKVNTRDKKLNFFLNNRVKPNFKMHIFKSNRELHRKVEDNLTEYVVELLRAGLKEYADTRRKAIKDTIDLRKKALNAVAQGEENLPAKMLQQAKLSFRRRDYLASVINSSIAFETWLRMQLQNKGLSHGELRQSILEQMRKAVELEILNPRDVHVLNELRIMRNRALHEGKIPLRNDAKFSLTTITRHIKS